MVGNFSFVCKEGSVFVDDENYSFYTFVIIFKIVREESLYEFIIKI